MPRTNCVERITPILSVRSLETSVDFYVKSLGFTLDWTWGEPADFGSVSLGGHPIMLCQGGQGQPGTWLWIGVDDIMPFYEKYRAQGVTIRLPPTNFPWAYEMSVEDPDGHVLRFGSDPLLQSTEKQQ